MSTQNPQYANRRAFDALIQNLHELESYISRKGRENSQLELYRQSLSDLSVFGEGADPRLLEKLDDSQRPFFSKNDLREVRNSWRTAADHVKAYVDNHNIAFETHLTNHECHSVLELACDSSSFTASYLIASTLDVNDGNCNFSKRILATPGILVLPEVDLDIELHPLTHKVRISEPGSYPFIAPAVAQQFIRYLEGIRSTEIVETSVYILQGQDLGVDVSQRFDPGKSLDSALEEAEKSLSGSITLAELAIDSRTKNCLEIEGIESLGDLASKSPSELAAIHNFGKVSLKEVRKLLSKFGLTLKDDEDEPCW